MSIYSVPLFGVIFHGLKLRSLGLVVVWLYTAFHSVLVSYLALLRLDSAL